MKRYKFQITIEEGNDEFWQSLQGKSGCEEITGCIKSALEEIGFSGQYGTDLKLIEFSDKD